MLPPFIHSLAFPPTGKVEIVQNKNGFRFRVVNGERFKRRRNLAVVLE
jgi:hypothetical protein